VPVRLCVQVSRRVLVTDPPVIVKTQKLMARAPPNKQVRKTAAGFIAHASGTHCTAQGAADPSKQVGARYAAAGCQRVVGCSRAHHLVSR
jgi:hypothetical protein